MQFRVGIHKIIGAIPLLIFSMSRSVYVILWFKIHIILCLFYVDLLSQNIS